MTADLIRGRNVPGWKARVPFPAPGSNLLHRVPPAALCCKSLLCPALTQSRERGTETRQKTEREREIQEKSVGNLIETENKSPSLIPFHLFLDQIRLDLCDSTFWCRTE